jgi:hypothetical protein
MGFQLLFDIGRRVLLVRFEGHVTEAALRDMSATTRRLVERQGASDAIVDFTGITRFDVSAEFVRSLAQARPVMEDFRRVLVAPADDVFGTLRMFGVHQVLVGNVPVVVRSLDRAYEVLGLDQPVFTPVTAP